jgi:hypothetical protein
VSQTLFIKPAQPGAMIRDPVTYRQLAAEGEEKPATAHWLRARDRGDVIETARPKAAKSAKE